MSTTKVDYGLGTSCDGNSHCDDPTAAMAAADGGVTDDKMRQPYHDLSSSLPQYPQQPLEMQIGRAR